MSRLPLAHPVRAAWLALGALAAAFILWRLAVWFWAADTIAVVASVALTAVFLLFAAPVSDYFCTKGAAGENEPPCLAAYAGALMEDPARLPAHAAALCGDCPSDHQCPRLARSGRGGA